MVKNRWFGKNHETAAWEVALRPTDPGRSVQALKVYGSGRRDKTVAPFVYDGTTPVEIQRIPINFTRIWRIRRVGPAQK